MPLYYEGFGVLGLKASGSGCSRGLGFTCSTLNTWAVVKIMVPFGVS